MQHGELTAASVRADHWPVTGRDGERARRIWRLASVGLTWLGLLMTAYVVAWKLRDGIVQDAHIYWATDPAHPYSLTGPIPPYVYSPAFIQIIAPLQWLSWPTFAAIWTGLEGLALVALAGPFALPVLFLEPVLYELDLGNVNLFLAVAVVAGFRWPAAWSFILLTKVTPGIGLLWFAVRREWRSLAIVLGVTAAIAAASFVVAPDLWPAWIAQLRGMPEKDMVVPLWTFGPRLALAAALIAIGARRNWRWMVPIAVVLAMPALRYTMFATLVAVIPLTAWRPTRRRHRELIAAISA